MGSGVTFESLLGHFGVGLPESLWGHFKSFWASVELGARPLVNCKQKKLNCKQKSSNCKEKRFLLNKFVQNSSTKTSEVIPCRGSEHKQGNRAK